LNTKIDWLENFFPHATVKQPAPVRREDEMRERLIGIDAGGTMTKVVLFDVEGNELGCERQPNHMLMPHAGWTERDAEQMWAATCRSIQALIEKTKTDPADILAVTPSGYGGGVYLVDRDGVPVRNAVVSTDTRSLPILDMWTATGVRKTVSAEIEQLVWPGQTLALLAWMQDNEPSVLNRTAHVLSCKDYLRLKLCGDLSTDPTDAGCAGILNVSRSEIATEAFKAASLHKWLDKLVPIGISTEVVGKVTATAAGQTGLKIGTPVVRGAYDVVGCAMATGVTNSSQLAAVAGTFSIHSTLHKKPALDPMPHIQTPYPIKGEILATTATPTSASNLEWFCKTAMAAEAEKAAASGQSIYEVCNDMVSGTLSGGSKVQFFPFLYDGPRGAPSGFSGMTASTSMADLLRSIYEGVVFAHRTDFNYLLTGPDAAKPNVIRFAGGPSRSAVWSQMFADGLGLPVEIANGAELGAKGGAICAAVATRAYASVTEAMSRMVKIEHRYEPDAARSEALTAKYKDYSTVVDMNVQAWAKTEAAKKSKSAVDAVRASAA
jgi:L-xylulokinase